MATRHNLCTNPAVSVDVTGWGGGSTPVRTDVTSEAFGRQWAARYTAETSTLLPPGQVTAGLTYTLSVYTYLTSGFPSNDGTAYIEWRDAGGGVISYSPAGYDIPGNAIGRIVVTDVAPPGAASAALTTGGLNFGSTPCDFTMLLMEQADTPGDYFDGDSENASWDGTPGLSSSTLDDAPAVNEGTLNVLLPPLGAAGSGTVTNPAHAAVPLPAAAVASAGTVTTTGRITAGLPAFTSASAGTVTTTGEAAVGLPKLTAAGSGKVTTTGEVATVLPAVDAAAAGTVKLLGAIAATLPAVDMTAEADVKILGTAHIGIPALDLAGAATVVTTGLMDVTLPALAAGSSAPVVDDDITIRVGPPQRFWSAGPPARWWASDPPSRI